MCNINHADWLIHCAMYRGVLPAITTPLTTELNVRAFSRQLHSHGKQAERTSLATLALTHSLHWLRFLSSLFFFFIFIITTGTIASSILCPGRMELQIKYFSLSFVSLPREVFYYIIFLFGGRLFCVLFSVSFCVSLDVIVDL